MPITAKLSKAFYERLGDAAANELVDWLNAVDGDYRSQLRELNELNFARFDAKMEQRFAEYDVKMEHRFAQLDVRFAQFEAKLIGRMFAFYTGQTVGLAALIYAMLHGK
jgi:hypothetical protein